jgi:hypothetical protein
LQVYLSFSYRDAVINGPFFEQFEDEGIALLGDQKSETWCVAKLERYLTELTGFVSIIPVRATDTDPGGYSEYIGQELELARRARVPRLVFVVLVHMDTAIVVGAGPAGRRAIRTPETARGRDHGRDELHESNAPTRSPATRTCVTRGSTQIPLTTPAALSTHWSAGEAARMSPCLMTSRLAAASRMSRERSPTK